MACPLFEEVFPALNIPKLHAIDRPDQFDPLAAAQALVDGRWTVDGAKWADDEDDRKSVESVLQAVLRELRSCASAEGDALRARVAPIHAAVVAKIDAANEDKLAAALAGGSIPYLMELHRALHAYERVVNPRYYKRKFCIYHLYEMELPPCSEVDGRFQFDPSAVAFELRDAWSECIDEEEGPRLLAIAQRAIDLRSAAPLLAIIDAEEFLDAASLIVRSDELLRDMGRDLAPCLADGVEGAVAAQALVDAAAARIAPMVEELKQREAADDVVQKRAERQVAAHAEAAAQAAQAAQAAKVEKLWQRGLATVRAATRAEAKAKAEKYWQRGLAKVRAAKKART